MSERERDLVNTMPHTAWSCTVAEHSYLQFSVQVALDPAPDLVSIDTFKVRHKFLHVFLQVNEPECRGILILDVEEASNTIR